jgi:selenocysteine-specific elongation factor
MSMPTKSIVIGTAGHIDHGKTALVRALTGVDTDRLPEEKRRGITIDLGFASLDAVADDGTPLRISFVDVPGHKLFIRNMLAGTGCIDAVLLVVSADEGIKPQTEEHLSICSLLGVRRGLTAITKVDSVDAVRLESVRSEISTFLRATFLEGRILPVSARTGDGLEDLRRELLSLALQSVAGDQDHLSRLPIDRAFVMKGFGTVVTGTLLSGSIRIGDALTLEPGNRAARVRGIQTHGRPEEIVQSGSRVALNLAGIDVSEVSRGQTLVPPETLTAVSIVDVEAVLLPGVRSVKHRSQVHFHAFTADTLATVSLYDYRPVEAGTRRLMRLRLHSPQILVPGDRFVLRQCSPASTIGGGVVMDAHPLPNLRKAKCLAWLEAISGVSLEQQLLLRVARHGVNGLNTRGLIAETGLTPEALRRFIGPQLKRNQIISINGDLLVTSEFLASANESIAGRLKTGETTMGIKRAELRSQTGLRKEVFDFVIERLAREQKLRLIGELIYPCDSDSKAAGHDQAELAAIAAAYDAAGLAAPQAAEVAAKRSLSEAEMRRLMILLLRDKILIRMGADSLCIHENALAKLKSQISELRGQTFDVASFKQITGLSRKYAIPLLEYLDRERVTRKVGERRLVL